MEEDISNLNICFRNKGREVVENTLLFLRTSETPLQHINQSHRQHHKCSASEKITVSIIQLLNTSFKESNERISRF